jgi:8-oxo-dGTP pyrophosphatase MutT (NUDIX family)
MGLSQNKQQECEFASRSFKSDYLCARAIVHTCQIVMESPKALPLLFVGRIQKRAHAKRLRSGSLNCYYYHMRAVGCFLEYDGKFVILLRHSHKPDGATWGLAGGKVEHKEADQDAMLRELEEETGYRAVASELEYLGDNEFVSSNGKPYVFVTYRVKLKDPHQVKLEESAHAAYKWVTASECYDMPNLIPGFHVLLRKIGYIK